MAIKHAKFLCSSEKLSQCPAATIEGRPVIEVALIGRSNVGKSSLINMLTSNKSLAKVSGTPGKTRLINHFEIDNKWILVDLPGYGYAKTSKSNRAAFSDLIKSYILKRDELYCLFVLIDIRHEPQKIDIEFMEMLAENDVPFGLIFTKSDKLSTTARKRQLEAYKAHLVEQWDEFPLHFVTSAQNGLGRDELTDYIANMADEFVAPEQEEQSAN